MRVIQLVCLIAAMAFVLPGCTIQTMKDRQNMEELRARMETVTARLDQMGGEIDDLKGQLSVLKARLDEGGVKDEVLFIEQEISKLESRLQAIETGRVKPGKKQVAPPPKKKSQKQYAHLGKGDIKVLSGMGNIDEASALAARLGTAGFAVGAIGNADKIVDRTTIYYAKGMRDRAENIAAVIGGEVWLKELTWKSTFKIIVVKGK